VSSYTEAIDLLYTEKTFILESTFQFPTWAHSIPERHLGLIKSLVLYLPVYEIENSRYAEYWQSTLKALQRMTHLERCRVIAGETYKTDKFATIVESLKALQSKTVFEVDFVNHYCENESTRVYYLHKKLVVNELECLV